ncbi:putative sensor histidine kinase pdtaS [Methanosarcinales archaeon]|nr:HAMP domain-containing protein [Candidatus Methanoperedens sp.]CAG0973297.1 putative sensor histidine kinase pdtaS [Methanosarcinales archaeon]
MRIKAKLISGFVIVSLLAGLVGYIGLYANNHVVTSFEKGEVHFGSILQASNEVSSYSKRAQGHTMLYLTLNNGTDKKKASERVASLREQIAIMDGKIQNPEALKILNDTKAKTDEMQSIIESLIKIHDSEMEAGTFDIKNHETLIRRLDTVSSNIRQNGLDLVEIELGLEEELNQKAKQDAASLYNLIFILSGIALISSMVIGIVIDRSISNPIYKLKDAAINIRKGNLGTKIDIRSNDEIGELSNEFNRMAQDLQKSNDEIISSKEYIYNIISSMDNSLIIVSRDCIIRTINNAACSLLDYKETELIGQPISKVLIEGETLLASSLINKNYNDKTNIVHNAESTFISKGLQKIPIIFSASIIESKYGNGQDIICVAQDITERKFADEQIKASLKEKEVLLREIHHRVKNNMQIISSLLSHQMENITDKNINEIFIDSQNRIISMSLVHEKLYQSRDLRNIDFGEYINDLGASLFQSYNIHSGNIKLNIRVENVYLDIDLAIPTGLIINELITNSLKYAFPKGINGEITVIFRSRGEMLELVVSDNGIGFPKDLDFRKTRSLGLHLVTILTENQLHGKIDMNGNKGTEFKIEFKGVKS